MKLLFLYGPPASGKLTIAQEIAAQTSYKLFDNHLTIDLIHSVFDPKDEQTWELTVKYRLNIIEDAAKHKIPGLIFTYMHENTAKDHAFIKKLLKLSDKHKFNVFFVRIECDTQTLLKRVENKSRLKKMKISNQANLKKVLDKTNFESISIEHTNSFSVVNNHDSPQKSAAQIINFVK